MWGDLLPNLSIRAFIKDNRNMMFIWMNNLLTSNPMGVWLMNLWHSTCICDILNNILNWTTYWKMYLKITLFNPYQYEPNTSSQYKKPLLSLDIVGIQFFINIFYIPIIVAWCLSYSPTCILQCAFLLLIYIIDAY